MAFADKKYKRCDNQDIEMANNQISANESRPAVTVLGTGDFGRALTKRLSLAGYDVVIGSRDPVKRKNCSHLMAFKIEPLEKALMITTLGDKLQGSYIIILLSTRLI